MIIHKQILVGEEYQDIQVPAGTEFLTAAVQRNSICVWYKCDPDNPPMPRKIAIIPTGHTPPEIALYLGTCMFQDGQIVLHVFEVVE
jgi:hypothetical protein